jgi:archaellum component FlaF (FlaF/FlaG flagellin family)
MKRRRILLLALALALLAIAASGTHGATSVALDRTASVDIVEQSAGLLAVSQTTTGYNSTLNTADLTVEVTNQISVSIDQVDISADGATKITGSLLPGATASVSFSGVDCDGTTVIAYDTGSLEQRIETEIRC